MHRIAPWVILGVFLIYLAVAAYPPGRTPDGFRIAEFARLPVVMNGRAASDSGHGHGTGGTHAALAALDLGATARGQRMAARAPDETGRGGCAQALSHPRTGADRRVARERRH